MCPAIRNIFQTGTPRLLSLLITKLAESGYFCESFLGNPCTTSGKNYATAYDFNDHSRSFRLRSGQALLHSLHTQYKGFATLLPQ